MQVGDEHRVELRVVAKQAELREHAVAAIEQQRGGAVLDQVPAAGPSGVLPRRRLPQHRDPHRDDQLYLRLTPGGPGCWPCKPLPEACGRGLPEFAALRPSSPPAPPAACAGAARAGGGNEAVGAVRPEGGAGLVEVERAEHLTVEEAVLAARASLAPLGCSALGEPDRLRHLPGLLLDLDHSLTPLALPPERGDHAHRRARLGGRIRAIPDFLGNGPAAGFPAFAESRRAAKIRTRWHTSAPRG